MWKCPLSLHMQCAVTPHCPAQPCSPVTQIITPLLCSSSILFVHLTCMHFLSIPWRDTKFTLAAIRQMLKVSIRATGWCRASHCSCAWSHETLSRQQISPKLRFSAPFPPTSLDHTWNYMVHIPSAAEHTSVQIDTPALKARYPSEALTVAACCGRVTRFMLLIPSLSVVLLKILCLRLS